MSEERIVALFDTAAHAERAAADLRSASIRGDAISLHRATSDAAASTTATAPAREKGFWANLFGGEPDHDTAVYDRSLEAGSTVLTVSASEVDVSRIMDVLEQHQPIDIDERASSLDLASGGASGLQVPAAGSDVVDDPYARVASDRGSVAAAPTGETTSGERIQLAAEELVVGKRVVNRGGTRIRRFVVETPVEEQVSLHDERVLVERRPVTDGAPVGEGAFTERAIEMTASAEEAVVSKTARVVEEVSLRKEAVDHVETVHGTVRREEIEIEQVPAAGSARPTDRPKRV